MCYLTENICLLKKQVYVETIQQVWIDFCLHPGSVRWELEHRQHAKG
jgi:hypothetical protein